MGVGGMEHDVWTKRRKRPRAPRSRDAYSYNRNSDLHSFTTKVVQVSWKQEVIIIFGSMRKVTYTT